ncbi:MAG TPA: tetratricopeptide repeat protein [Chryseolinea sp.]|nr:tetratricopeptide repeat protein [Chryseolinea sp.]
MPSLVSGFEYDIFISYRHKDNKGDRWVSRFVAALKTELESTFKEEISVYYDENPHDGLIEAYTVDKSLANKLKCLVFIPIISRTYCDPASFAWKHEFLVFQEQAKADGFGLDVELRDGNVSSRILPIQIHELHPSDQQLFEKTTDGPLRAIPFIYTALGVNRPLMPRDSRVDSLNKTLYRDQINKTANAIEKIIATLQASQLKQGGAPITSGSLPPPTRRLWSELNRRNVLRAMLAYVIAALAIRQTAHILSQINDLPLTILRGLDWTLILLFAPAMVLAWLYESSPAGFIRTTSQQAERNPYRPSQKKPFTGGGGFGLLTLLLVFQASYIYYLQRGSGLEPVNPDSIAVLPFENRSDDPEDAFFADGLTDEIINHLSIIRELHVINRQSIQEYKGKNISYKRIAEELNVSNVLTGSVRRSGNDYKISATVIQCSTNKYLWGKTFERRGEDLMALQSEIAKGIASVLKIPLNRPESQQLDHLSTQNPTAYDYYIKGRALYYQYQAASNDKAISYFKNAIALDPSYALAWAGLGDAYSQLNARFGREVKWLDSSIVAGSKAVALDSTSSDAYKALANAMNYKKRYDTAFVLLQKAVALNPSNASAIGNLGTTYFLQGDLPQALRLQKRSAGLNPKNAIPFQIAGMIYRLLGDLKNAESWLEKSLELNNSSYWDTYETLGYCYVSRGDPAKARALVLVMLANMPLDSRTYEIAGIMAHFAGDIPGAQSYFEKSIALNESYEDDPASISAIGLGQILLATGHTVEAEVYLSHALEMNLQEVAGGSQDDDAPFYIAGIYAIRGQRGQSLEWLTKAVNANWIDYAEFENSPWFTQYRHDDAFVSLIAAVRKKVQEMRRQAERM